jgi:hypothetical protein
MTAAIHVRPNPEEEEFDVKQRELEDFEFQLIEQELQLSELQAELSSFEKLYLKVVGCKYAELDEIEAQIAELRARRDPLKLDVRQAAQEARARAEESRAGTANLAVSKPRPSSTSQSLKRLYRLVAKRIHPDLATDEKDRARRQMLMARANDDYQAGDEARLRAILEEYESSPETVLGDGVAADLVRVIRKIAQIKRRLAEIEKTIGELMKSEIAELKARAEEESKQGRDLLAQMAQAVSQRIEQARSTLAHLSKGQA